MPVVGVQEVNESIRLATTEAPKETTRRVHRAIALESLRRIMQKTPVDTGRLRGNWQVTTGQIAGGVVDVTPQETTYTGSPPPIALVGSAAFAQGEAEIAKTPAFSETFISNNLPYAAIVEFGEFVPPDPGPSKDPRPGRKGRILVRSGRSVQGHAMIRTTFEEILQAFGGRQ